MDKVHKDWSEMNRTMHTDISPLLLTTGHTVKSKGKFLKILWPSQNIWTLKKLGRHLWILLENLWKFRIRSFKLFVEKILLIFTLYFLSVWFWQYSFLWQNYLQSTSLFTRKRPKNCWIFVLWRFTFSSSSKEKIFWRNPK